MPDLTTADAPGSTTTTEADGGSTLTSPRQRQATSAVVSVACWRSRHRWRAATILSISATR
ncbi:hypothetical protein [Arthrobacter pigmenti]